MNALFTRVLEDGSIEIRDDLELVEPVTLTLTNRRWRRRVVQHVAACTGVPARDVIRELERAERRAS